MAEQSQITSEAPEDKPIVEQQAEENRSSVKLIVGILAGIMIFIIVGFILSIVLAFFSPGAAAGVELIRDFLIIVVAIEGLMIGAALVILTLQIARLINLLQNEIKPILQQTNDTVQTVKGTATFMTKNVAEPVIKAGGILAWFSRLFGELFAIFRLTR